MKNFKYEALNDAGKPIKGIVEAANSDEAIAKIRKMSLFPVSVKEDKKPITLKSQDEVKQMLADNDLTEYEKFVKVAFRLAVPGETLVVVNDGKIETVLRALETTKVVVKNIAVGGSAEEYAMDGSEFNKKYEALPPAEYAMNIGGVRWDMAQAKGKVRGFEYKGESFKFVASYGEETYCEDGDMLVTNDEGSFYRIARNDFEVTYKAI